MWGLFHSQRPAQPSGILLLCFSPAPPVCRLRKRVRQRWSRQMGSSACWPMVCLNTTASPPLPVFPPSHLLLVLLVSPRVRQLGPHEICNYCQRKRMPSATEVHGLVHRQAGTGCHGQGRKQQSFLSARVRNYATQCATALQQSGHAINALAHVQCAHLNSLCLIV